MKTSKIGAVMSRVDYWITPVKDLWPIPLSAHHPRRVHAIGMGAPRSGTVSLSELFSGLRSAHEPESRFFTRHVLDYRLNLTDRETFERYLLKRDRRLQLEMDSSYINAEVAEVLADVFPEARMILTLRDCFAWTDSMLNFLQNKPEFLSARKGAVNKHLQLRLGQMPYSYRAGEQALAERGLPPLENLFKHWQHHNQHVIDSVPADRLLVIRTEDIGKRSADVEEFLGLSSGALTAGVHSNTAPARHSLLQSLDANLLADLAERHCGALMHRYFPDSRLRVA